MAGVFRGLLLVFAFGLSFGVGGAIAQAASPTETWTVIIDGNYSGIVYTWWLKSDGTYEEDGRFASGNAPAQATQTGTWARQRSRLTLKQDAYGFKFDGKASAEMYSGTLFQYGQPVARFCAWKGLEVPVGCDDESVG